MTDKKLEPWIQVEIQMVSPSNGYPTGTLVGIIKEVNGSVLTIDDSYGDTVVVDLSNPNVWLAILT